MRAFNRVLSAFLAAVLIVAGVLTILEICRAALGQPPAVVQWPKLLPKLRSNSYDDAGPILVCIGLAIVGLLLVISGVRRGKPYALPTGSTAPGVRTEINRRSLQRAMRATVLGTERVESSTVTLRRRSAVIVARASTVTIDGLESEVRQRLEKLLANISLVEPPRLKIKTYPASPPVAKASMRAPVGVVTGQPGQAGQAGQAAQRGAGVPPAATPASPAAQQVLAQPAVDAESEKAAWSAPDNNLVTSERKTQTAARAPEPPPEAAPIPEPTPKARSSFAAPATDRAPERDARPERDRGPERDREPQHDPKPTRNDPPTARLDELLSSDPEDESR